MDEPKWADAVPLSNGIILVPREIVELLSDDSQLAAVLADNIAVTLEKQTPRLSQPNHALTATEVVAVSAASVFVVGFGGPLVGKAILDTKKAAALALLDQSGRVGLRLMHDAGYDVQQAPLAWWTIASSQERSRKHPLSVRAADLYRTIGVVWQNYAGATASTTSPATPTSTAATIPSKAAP